MSIRFVSAMRMKMRLVARVAAFAMVLSAWAASPAAAKTAVARTLAVNGLFTNHMVLQRNAADPIWGVAEPGKRVRVSCDGKQATAVTDSAGHWRTKLPAMPAGGPYALTIKTARQTIVVHDVLIGEVWLCSGQSNMAFEMLSAYNHVPAIKAATDAGLRFITVPGVSSRRPQTAVHAQWQRCNPKTVAHFSAVAYYFGSYLRRKLKVPVGLINASYSGSIGEAWVSLSALRKVPRLAPIVTHYELAVRGYQAYRLQTQGRLKKWRAAGRPKNVKRPTMEITYTPKWFNDPDHLYNGMIAPLIPYRIRGVLWYQGEFNADRAWQYRKLLPTLIGDWRARWGEGNFPFFIVQLPGFLKPSASPQDASWKKSNWSEMREAQAHVARVVPNCGLAVTIDTSNPKFSQLHPSHKKQVGRRLGLLALAKAYHQKVAFSGPTYDKMKINGNRVRLFFHHVGGGLKIRGSLKHAFAVAGADHKFHWATAKIDGTSIVVSSAAVPHPIAVRYGWGNNPNACLFNVLGLPMAPFRTDHFWEYTKYSWQHA